MPMMDERGPGYGATVSALAVGQILSWATLYYAFSSFVLPMQRELGWDKPTLMGAFTLGLAVWGAATYAAGAAIDAGHGRSVMAWGSAARVSRSGPWLPIPGCCTQLGCCWARPWRPPCTSRRSTC